MKDLDVLTKMGPNARRDVLTFFAQEVQNNDIPREILADWGLRLESNLIDFTGRVFEPVEIMFGQNRIFRPPSHKPADWGSVVCKNSMLRTVSSFAYRI